MTALQSKKGRRFCRMCRRRIDPQEEAIRVANVKEWHRPAGRMRFWLCWRCAGELEQVLDVMTRKKSTQGGKVLELA